jgi:hypothetical protein
MLPQYYQQKQKKIMVMMTTVIIIIIVMTTTTLLETTTAKIKTIIYSPVYYYAKRQRVVVTGTTYTVNMITRYKSTMMICIWLLLLISNVTATNTDHIKIHVLIYETAVEEDNNAAVTASQRKRQLRSQSLKSKASPAQTLLKQMNDLNQFDLLEASIFGQEHEFIGFGSKLIQVLPVLKQMQQRHQQLHHADSDTLVVISVSRDVLFNSHSNHLDDQMTVAA